MKEKYRRKIERQLDVVRVLVELTYYDEEERNFAFADYKNAFRKINVYHDGYTETLQDPYWDFQMKIDKNNMNYAELSNLVNEIMHKSESDPELFLWLYDHNAMHNIIKLMIEQKWKKIDSWDNTKCFRRLRGGDKLPIEERIVQMSMESKWRFLSAVLVFYQRDKEICERMRIKNPSQYRYSKNMVKKNRRFILLCLESFEDAFCPIGRQVRIQTDEENYIGVCISCSSGMVKIVPAEDFSMKSFTRSEFNYVREYDLQELMNYDCFLEQDERYEFIGY